MDQQTFDKLAAQTRLKPRALRMAESVLCHGMSATLAGKKEHASRQLATQAANRILQQLKSVSQYPDDWVATTTRATESLGATGALYSDHRA
jgi:alcohol dehydrogenase class IV